MNQVMRNKIGNFIIDNSTKIISILLLIHILIGLTFLLFNRLKEPDIKSKTQTEIKEDTTQNKLNLRIK
jgi:hypothetical protein